MTRLIQPDICFDKRYGCLQQDNIMRAQDAFPILPPLAWLMTLNTVGLTRLCLREICVPDPRELRCVTPFLSKLTCITQLKVETSLSGGMPWLTVPMLFILFFSYPKSPVTFEVKAELQPCNDDEATELRLKVAQSMGVKEVESGLALLNEAEEDLVLCGDKPFVNLKELVLSNSSLGYTANQIHRFLRSCPVLDMWDVSCLLDDTPAATMAKTIRETLHQHHRHGQ